MPKLPDATSLDVVQPRPNMGVVGYDNGGATRAAANLGATVANIGQAIGERQDQLEIANAKSAFLQAKVKTVSALEDDPNYQTHAQRYTDALNQAKESALGMVRSNRAQRLLGDEFDLQAAEGLAQINHKARVMEVDDGRANLLNLMDANRETALRSGDEPTRSGIISATQQAIDGAVEKGYLKPHEAVNLRKKFTESYAEGAVSLLPLDERIKTLGNKDQPGTVDFIPSDKRQVLLDRALNEKRILQDRAQAQADRAEAKAGRALLQMDQQISTGIPATAEQWDVWGQTVKGTPYEADYNQRLQEEQQVQQVLRLPINEQVDFVQKAQAKLEQGGGTLHEIANTQRLAGAVNANIKQLQEQPLLYAQGRTGEQIQPLDMNALLQPGANNPAVAELQNRVDTINGLQKQYGTRVQMRPLLPNEAKDLADSFTKLSVGEKETVLKNLNDAVGGPVMVPMMQEVAKNQPVLAVASGLVSNQTTNGRSVASLVLQGDELLRNKQIDLPPEQDMNAAFQKYIGNAIQTIPGKQAAYLATKAAYAQLLKEAGTFKQGTNNFDAHRFQQAAKLVTGGVFEYNGSNILPPKFGFDESQSRDMLRSITPAQIKAWGGVSGMSDDDAAQFIKNAPLESIGIGKYRVTAGAGILRNQAGGPFIMNFQ